MYYVSQEDEVDQAKGYATDPVVINAQDHVNANSSKFAFILKAQGVQEQCGKCIRCKQEKAMSNRKRNQRLIRRHENTEAREAGNNLPHRVIPQHHKVGKEMKETG